MRTLLYELKLGKNETEIFENVILNTLDKKQIKKLSEKYVNDNLNFLHEKEERALKKYYEDEEFVSDGFPLVSLILKGKVDLRQTYTRIEGVYYVHYGIAKEMIEEGDYEIVKMVIGKDRHYGVEVINMLDEKEEVEKQITKLLLRRLKAYTDDRMESFTKEMKQAKKIYNALSRTI